MYFLIGLFFWNLLLIPLASVIPGVIFLKDRRKFNDGGDWNKLLGMWFKCYGVIYGNIIAATLFGITKNILVAGLLGIIAVVVTATVPVFAIGKITSKGWKKICFFASLGIFGSIIVIMINWTYFFGQ